MATSRTTSPAGRAEASSRRAAATVALFALVVALGTAVAGILSNFGLALGNVACVAVLGVTGWYVVSRTGTARAIAIIVGLCAVAAFVVAVVAADVVWWRVLVVVLATGVSVEAARRALRPSSGSATASQGPPPIARPVLLMNPWSGGGKVERFHLVDECRRRGIEPVVLAKGDDLVQLAEQAVASGADAVGMAGGDGSQALVAEIAARHGLPMAVIPAGTRNHLALDIGLDRADVVGALDAYRDGVERRIDLATVNERVFVNNSSLGLYARIVQSPGYREAKLQTSAAMLPRLIGPTADPFDLRFTAPDGTEHSTAQIVMVSNNPYHLESLSGLGTRERLDGGVLGIAAITIANAMAWEQFLVLEASGRLAKFPGLVQWNAPEFELRSDAPVEIGVDGEALVMDPPLMFRSMPSALRLLVPKTAPGPPATRRLPPLLAASTLAELGRLALGRAPAARA